MGSCKVFCCGPQRLPWYLQILAYIVVLGMIAITIFTFFDYVIGSLGHCTEHQWLCAKGTVQLAALQFVVATFSYFLFIAVLFFPLVLFWTPERSVTIAAVAGFVWMSVLFLLLVLVFVFAPNLKREPHEVNGFIGLVTATVLLGLNFVLMLAVAIHAHISGPLNGEHSLLINKY